MFGIGGYAGGDDALLTGERTLPTGDGVLPTGDGSRAVGYAASAAAPPTALTVAVGGH